MKEGFVPGRLSVAKVPAPDARSPRNLCVLHASPELEAPAAPEAPNRQAANTASPPSIAVLLSVAALAISCSDPGPSGTSPTTVVSSAPRGGGSEFWLRRSELSDSPGGPVSRRVEGPIRVEVFPDGFLRSSPGAEEQFEGFLAPSLMETPSDRSGLMLYAQRSTELHFGTPDGPVIGLLHPGAMVAVAPHGHDHWTVAIPRYRTESEQLLLAFTERSTLGLEPRTEVAPVLTGDRLRDHRLLLMLWEEANVGVQALCGDLYLDGFHAKQYYRGVELRGVIAPRDWPPLPEPWGPNRCPPAHIYRNESGYVTYDGRDALDLVTTDSIPASHTLVRPPDPDPLGALIRHGGTIYWLVSAQHGLECQEWRFRPRSAPSWARGAAVTKMYAELGRVADRRRATFSVEYAPSTGQAAPGVIDMFGPHLADGGGSKCGEGLALIAAESDRLYLSPTITVSGAEGVAVAFRKDQVEHWFISKDGCLSARPAAEKAQRMDESTVERFGLRRNCASE